MPCPLGRPIPQTSSIRLAASAAQCEGRELNPILGDLQVGDAVRLSDSRQVQDSTLVRVPGHSLALDPVRVAGGCLQEGGIARGLAATAMVLRARRCHAKMRTDCTVKGGKSDRMLGPKQLRPARQRNPGERLPADPRAALAPPDAVLPLTRDPDLLAREQPEISRDQTEISRDQSLLARDLPRISREQPEISRDQNEISREQTQISRDQNEISRDQSLLTRDLILLARDQLLLTRDQKWISRDANRVPAPLVPLSPVVRSTIRRRRCREAHREAMRGRPPSSEKSRK
jgi:hypothetical protein